MPTLRRILASPRLELAVGLILLVAGLMEIRDIILVKMPNRGPMLPHAAATIGAALVLRSLPGMFLGLEIIDRGIQGVSLTPALAFLDRLAHSHAVDLFMGLVLVGAGLGDLLSIIASGRAMPGVMGLNTATGAVVFGLAPAVNALLALYKGAKRIDRERPARLLDRAVKNRAVQTLAGLAMFLGGAAEMWASWHEKIVPGISGTGAGLCGGLAVLGLFGVLTGLPGVYEGVKALSGQNGRPSS